jgi:alkylation response protein AidB-like acyl-CoA dehydrogenase
LDLRPAPEEEAFRREVREFISTETRDWHGYICAESDEEWEYSIRFCKKLNEKGWIGIAWPKEYGGHARPYTDQLILLEEMAYFMAPYVLIYHGWDRVAWTLLMQGTEEQKKRHLPVIQAADEVWCQTFTEPDVGSDLASLETRAVRDGDDYILNGQKTFTSIGWRADWALCPARTDPAVPKHEGLSHFLLDLRSPGIERFKLYDMLRQHHFGHTMLTDVRVPRENLLGGVEGEGWRQMRGTLNAANAGIAVRRYGLCRRGLDETVNFVRNARRNGVSLAEDPHIRRRLTELFVELRALRILAYSVGSMQGSGELPFHQASMAKMFGCELQRRIFAAAMDIVGHLGMIEGRSPLAPADGRISHEWLESFGQTIAGGASEIHRNIIAHGLGMPRS